MAESPRSWRLPDDSSAVPIARAFVRDCLAEARDALPAHLVEDAELIASELVTNAREHGEPPVDLTITSGERGVRLKVTGTAGDGEPAIVAIDPDAPGGRGLTIVAALASDWGFTVDDGRLAVWADLAIDRR